MYDAYTSLLYDTGVVVDANTNIPLVPLNTPVVPPRGATPADGRPPIACAGEAGSAGDSSVLNDIRSRAKHVTPMCSCVAPPPPFTDTVASLRPFCGPQSSDMKPRRNNTDRIMALIGN